MEIQLPPNEQQIRELKILKGQCLNIAGNVYAQKLHKLGIPEDVDKVLARSILDFAKELYIIAKEEEFIHW